MSSSAPQSQPIPRVASGVSEAVGLGHTAVRLGLVLVLLAAAVAGHFAVRRQLEPAAALSPGKLAAPLSQTPMQIGNWHGEDRPVQDARSLYADEHLQRSYIHKNGKQGAILWMAFSQVGADRGHHPEVCMAVAGKPEDVSGRGEIECPGHAAPIQQYCFGDESERQWVYYWHYTLPAPGADQLSELQQAYRRLRARPASLTIEVFVPQSPEGNSDAAHEFVRLVDQEIQSLVGPRAQRGSQRLPVTVIPTNDPAA